MRDSYAIVAAEAAMVCWILTLPCQAGNLLHAQTQVLNVRRPGRRGSQDDRRIRVDDRGEAERAAGLVERRSKLVLMHGLHRNADQRSIRERCRSQACRSV